MNEPFLQLNESFLHIKKWQEINPKLKAGFTTRNGGVSESPFRSLNLGLHVKDKKDNVIENRTNLAEKLTIPIENWVSGEQVHQTEIKIINGDDRGKGARSNQNAIQGTDGLITNKSGILCTAFFADCVPLFFFDPKSGYIGIAHAGWKGTIHLIAERMIESLESLGVNVADLLVVVGPCISKSFYEVDDHVINLVDSKYRKKTVVPKGSNRYLLDLKQLNVEILLQSGVLRHNIDITNYCTFNHKNLFFSHRRDNGETGRMLGFIGYTP